MSQGEGYHINFSPLFFQWLGFILFTGIVAGNLLRKEGKEEGEADSAVLEKFVK